MYDYLTSWNAAGDEMSNREHLMKRGIKTLSCCQLLLLHRCISVGGMYGYDLDISTGQTIYLAANIIPHYHDSWYEG